MSVTLPIGSSLDQHVRADQLTHSESETLTVTSLTILHDRFNISVRSLCEGSTAANAYEKEAIHRNPVVSIIRSTWFEASLNTICLPLLTTFLHRFL